MFHDHVANVCVAHVWQIQCRMKLFWRRKDLLSGHSESHCTTQSVVASLAACPLTAVSRCTFSIVLCTTQSQNTALLSCNVSVHQPRSYRSTAWQQTVKLFTIHPWHLTSRCVTCCVSCCPSHGKEEVLLHKNLHSARHEKHLALTESLRNPVGVKSQEAHLPCVVCKHAVG